MRTYYKLRSLFQAWILLRKGAQFPLFFTLILPMFLALFLTASVLSNSSYSRDMSGRMGVGFINSFANTSWARPVPAASVKYGISKDTAVLIAAGFNTNIPTAYTFAGKVFRNIFFEQNMNFYGAAAIAMLKDIVPGFEVQTVFGAEFFIPGIESIGWSFETGVSGTNVSGSFGIRTIGYTFLNAGMHFYL